MPSVTLRIVPILMTMALVDRPMLATRPMPLQSAATIELVGLSGQRRVVGAGEITPLPHIEAVVSSHGVTGRYRGVPLGDLLRLVDRPAGEALRGKALATAISVEASDGYRVAFALAEVDSGFSSKTIFLADARDGVPLDTAEGPFRVIVPDEKRPARWAKKVVRIRLVAIE